MTEMKVPIRPSPMVMAGLAPRARRVPPLLGAQAQLAADGLTGDEHGGQPGDSPEHAEGDGLGFDGPLGHVGTGFHPERRRDLPDGLA